MISQAPDAAADVAAWHGMVTESIGNFDISTSAPHFLGWFRTVDLGDELFMSMRAGAHVMTRSSAAPTAEPSYVFSLRTEGPAWLTQNGRTAAIKPGDFFFYDLTQPAELAITEEYTGLLVRVPQRRFGIPTEYLRELTAVAMGDEEGAAPVLAGLLTGLDRVSQRSLLGQNTLVGAHVAGLIEAMLREQIQRLGVAIEFDARRRLREDIDRYIELHLGDHELSVARIASAHFISGRTLHKLYAEDQRSVWSWVLQRRIDRAKADLGDPMQASVNIPAIAHRWGFGDSAYFTRCFKAHTGVTPGEWRSSAL